MYYDFIFIIATLTFDPPCYYLIRPYHFTSRIWGEGRIFFQQHLLRRGERFVVCRCNYDVYYDFIFIIASHTNIRSPMLLFNQTVSLHFANLGGGEDFLQQHLLRRKDSLYVDVIIMCIMILFLLLPATLTFDPPCCYLIRLYHFTSRIWGEGRIFLLRVHLPQQHCISSQSTCVGHILR